MLLLLYHFQAQGGLLSSLMWKCLHYSTLLPTLVVQQGKYYLLDLYFYLGSCLLSPSLQCSWLREKQQLAVTQNPVLGVHGYIVFSALSDILGGKIPLAEV